MQLLTMVFGLMLGSAVGTQASANPLCDDSGSLTIVSASDDGQHQEGLGPYNSIDGDIHPDSRWSSQSQGTPKSLVLDLGAEQTLKGLAVAWYKGDSRKSEFSIEASVDGEVYNSVVPARQSNGNMLEPENYSFDPVSARFVRINANGNDSNNWNSIVEVVAYGCGVAVDRPEGQVQARRRFNSLFGLDPDKTPGENFDLSGWYITTPADDDGDGRADNIYENELAAGWTDARYFYTDPATGGMVFKVTPSGATTSANTNFTRTELRGMLRKGDYSIPVRGDASGPTRNNWVFSSAPVSTQAMAGGVDGKLTATLAVNRVTRLGEPYQVGRVVIGQIHGKKDEPIRLYYRKLPTNKNGSIYYAHAPEAGDVTWVDVIGGRSDWIENPPDGIALDEIFSYEIEVKGEPEGDSIIPMLYLRIIRDDGSEVVAQPFDMRDSGFDAADEFMFFKAGAYTGNNTSPQPETDFDKVIFYKLDYVNGPVPEGFVSRENAGEVQVAQLGNAGATLPGIVFDDTFADGGRDEGPDSTDTNWWTTSSGSAIEVAPGKLGLVSGSSGRGLRATFDPQTLSEGQTIQARFTFTTPETIGVDKDSAFRIGLYDKLGRSALEGDLEASSKEPNSVYDGLPGYMVEFDINPSDAAAASIDIRKHKDDNQGRLLGTSKGYQRLGGGGDPYQFAPGETYTGVMSIRKINGGLEISAALTQDGQVLSTFSLVDEGSDVNNFGMLAFHVNSDTFGSSNKPDTPDNGLDFSRVVVEVLP